MTEGSPQNSRILDPYPALNVFGEENASYHVHDISFLAQQQPKLVLLTSWILVPAEFHSFANRQWI